jgi:proteasome accessory factor C
MTSRRTVSRLSRILSLIPYVLSKDGVDVKEILDRFDYTEAELIRDLNTVFVCGLPGYGPGDLMEAFIDDNEVVIDAADYFARAPRLTPAEALGLLAAGLTITGSGHGSPELASAVKKLSRAVMGDAADAISIEVAPGMETLDLLRDAAAGEKAVRIRYRSLSKEEETERDVEPWTVFTTLGNWYVQGHCRLVDAERVFRVDRIRTVEVLDESFERPVEITTPVVTYSPADDDVVCTIALSPAARWVLEYYPVVVVSEGDGETVISFSSPEAQIPARLLLRLGASARLVDGDEVRKAVREMGRSLLQKYQ